jgi:uncharacterized protein (TIGR02145 family)
MKTLSKLPLILLALCLFASCGKDDSGNTSDEITFGTMADQDGNSYKTVTIGTQTWMAENLKTTTYNDGAAIPYVSSTSDWGDNRTGAYCYYNNSASNGSKYGFLYNWYVVNTGLLAPEGWHVASDAEWNTLIEYLTNNGFGYEGSGDDVAKAMASVSGWEDSDDEGDVGYDQSTNNSSGFNALPGGFRYCEGGFDNLLYESLIGIECDWWTSSSSDGAHCYGLSYKDAYYSTGNIDKRYGYYVRCIKD